MKVQHPLAHRYGNSKRYSALDADVRPREFWAWAMYDFANSGYTTVVITALFNAYFVVEVAKNASWATFAWTSTLSASYGLVVLSAPLIGAYADLRGAKKSLLALTTAGCVVFTALLYFAQPETLEFTVFCVVLSNFFFGTGENLIAAFLPEISNTRALGRVSGWGWSLGYIGGLITLGVCLLYVLWASAHGQTDQQFVPVTMLITAAIFAIASLPTFILLRDRAAERIQKQATITGMFELAWSRVWNTFRHVRQFQDLYRFLICSLFYQAGIQAVITLTAVYANRAMGFTIQQTLLLVLVVNLSAAGGALVVGHIEDRIGHVKAIAMTLVFWIAALLLAWTAHGPLLFWIAANGVGVCLGASQSAGRALVGVLAPLSQVAECFGLWGLSVKLASIIGPITYGMVSWLAAGDHRLSLLITIAYFVIGLALLCGVNPKRGRRAALRADRPVRGAG
ncbi:MFS transporter [Burkholderia cepacia]|uniref:MFS transporter n=1 Tax=Burkholderia cepacia TaxID=292 RepID=UPI001906ADEC|nr:MFS transporter [Burkholderia cepacia]MBJ9752199.1 MFS transporter [Burkholderia cepacia]